MDHLQLHEHQTEIQDVFNGDEQCHLSSTVLVSQLLDAVRCLNILASMDNDRYHDSLSRNSTACGKQATDESNDTNIVDTVSLQQSLADIQDSFVKQHDHNSEHADTGRAIGSLARAIYSFHSSLHALKTESDQQTQEQRKLAVEVQSLQEQVGKLKNHNNKLKSHVRELAHEKDDLSERLKQSLREKKILIRHAKNLTAEIDSSRQTQTELQVLAHEHVLMVSCRRERTETSETESSFSMEAGGNNGNEFYFPTDDSDLSHTEISPATDPPRMLVLSTDTTGGTAATVPILPPVQSDGNHRLDLHFNRCVAADTTHKNSLTHGKGLLDDAIQVGEHNNSSAMVQSNRGISHQQQHPNAFLRGLGFNRRQEKNSEDSDGVNADHSISQKESKALYENTKEVTKNSRSETAFHMNFFGIGGHDKQSNLSNDNNDKKDSTNDKNTDIDSKELRKDAPRKVRTMREACSLLGKND